MTTKERKLLIELARLCAHVCGQEGQQILELADRVELEDLGYPAGENGAPNERKTRTRREKPMPGQPAGEVVGDLNPPKVKEL